MWVGNGNAQTHSHADELSQACGEARGSGSGSVSVSGSGSEDMTEGADDTSRAGAGAGAEAGVGGTTANPPQRCGVRMGITALHGSALVGMELELTMHMAWLGVAGAQAYLATAYHVGTSRVVM